MQEFELSQFLKGNKWVSDAVILNPGAENDVCQLGIDISPEGHDLICDHGIQQFEQRIQARLSSLSVKEDCWSIRLITPQKWEWSVPGLQHNFPPVLSHIDAFPVQRLLMDVSPDLLWFSGHFPDKPIFAGVVQLHWAVTVSVALFKFSEVPVEVKRLKFKSIVTPPKILELTLEMIKENEVQFEFSSKEKSYSLGRLIFKQEIPC